MVISTIRLFEDTRIYRVTRGTLLYHDNISPNIPKGPIWVYFGFEDSCPVGTFAVKGHGREVRVVDLDGSRSVLLGFTTLHSGTMDVQNAIWSAKDASVSRSLSRLSMVIRTYH